MPVHSASAPKPRAVPMGADASAMAQPAPIAPSVQKAYVERARDRQRVARRS